MGAGFVLEGGIVLSDDGTLVARDLAVEGGVVVEAPVDRSARRIDVSGALVTPGLIDLHTHVFRGKRGCVDPVVFARTYATTTMIDAGSAGAQMFDAFRLMSVDQPGWPRVRAMVNISAVGTAAEFRGELRSLEFCDESAAIETGQRHSDIVVGVKVRASADVGGSNVLEALGRARRVADSLHVPLMCHLGPAPARLIEILEQLHRGDILTHAFTGFSDNHVARTSTTLSALREAQERGVVIDVGHGQSGFSFDVAEVAFAAGILPTTISTDLHVGSVSTAENMPAVMTKCLALGMPLEAVLAAATTAPAAAVGLQRDGIGSLEVGSVADIAVLRLMDVEVLLTDAFGADLLAQQRFEVALTVQEGELVFDASTS